jgi:hypothetical protein
MASTLVPVGFSLVEVNMFRAVSSARCRGEKQVSAGYNDKEAGYLSAHYSYIS